MNKSVLRKKHLQTRKQMDFKEVHQKSLSIMKTLMTLDCLKGSSDIFGYMSFNNEVDCYLIKDMIGDTRDFMAPRMLGDGQMVFSRISAYEDLVMNSYGIMEPRDIMSQVSPKPGDVVLVPGVCFDKKGYRIGYGGGYYDRMIERYPDAIYIGMSFENQLTESIPAEGHDERLDYLVTEERVIRIQS